MTEKGDVKIFPKADNLSCSKKKKHSVDQMFSQIFECQCRYPIYQNIFRVVYEPTEKI